METKNLSIYNYNVNLSRKSERNINSIKKLFLFLLLIISVISIIGFSSFRGFVNNGHISVADFKTDISMISEISKVLEIERRSGKNLEVSQFGSDGKLMHYDEITPDLKKALIKMIDTNNDEKISNEEMSEAGIMKLKADEFQKELKRYQFNLTSSDHNLKKFIVITKGKNAGTILYNGNIKYIDNEEKQYFGLELCN